MLTAWLRRLFAGTAVTADRVEPPPGAAGPLAERTFHLGIVGESFANDDGSSRQRIIKRCRAGEVVTLVREPNNPHDHLAVAVRRQRTGEQLGYLGRGHGLSKPIEQKRVTAIVAEINGGRIGTPLRGVVLHIAVWPGSEKSKRVKQSKPVTSVP